MVSGSAPSHRTSFALATMLALVSGMAGLCMEGLWERILSNILGDTIVVSSAVILVFFAGLSFGAAYFRKRQTLNRSPWRLYGMLQLGIAVCLIMSLLFSLAGFHLNIERSATAIVTLQILGIVILLVGVPVFLMGGTLLCLIEGAITGEKRGRIPFLYGINTIGGALGIAFVTFHSCYVFGVSWSLKACTAAYGLMGIAGLLYHRSAGRFQSRPASPAPSSTVSPAPLYLPATHQVGTWTIGFVVLGFEFVFLSAYAQVGQNSAWSFGAMLILVISCLGFASLLVAILPFDRQAVLTVMFLAATCGMAAFPSVFFYVTDGLTFESTASGSLSSYMGKLLKTGLLSAGPPLLCAGFITPLIMEDVNVNNAAGRPLALGRLLCINALGAVMGIVAVQFVLFPLFGLWGACGAISFVSLVGCAVLVVPRIVRVSRGRLGYAGSLVGCAVLCLASLLQSPSQTSLYNGEQLVELRCGADGIVCIKRSEQGHLLLSHNNHYCLSSTAASLGNLKMGHVPLLLHPAPRETAYIGLATGLTAAAAVKHVGVDKITVLELSPLVIALSGKHFAAYTGDFHLDARVSIREADGVHYFASTDREFDVVTGDLFFPWQKGASRLFSREHFSNVRSSLRPDGLFCQWLPGWQLNDESLRIIATTFASVFPRGILIHLPLNDRIAVGLVGRNSDEPFDQISLNTLWRSRLAELDLAVEKQTLPVDFSTTLNQGPIVGTVPPSPRLNTMDRPILEPVVIRLEPTL